MPHNRAILLIDDNPDDRFLLRRALVKSGIINPIHEADSGSAAIAYLNGDGKFADRTQFPFPGILLLDLNMPLIDGFGVLQWIRSKLAVQGLLVIVLSRLDELSQVNRAYALGANSFLTKPGNETDLQELIDSFRDYWIVKNKPPSIRPASGL